MSERVAAQLHEKRCAPRSIHERICAWFVGYTLLKTLTRISPSPNIVTACARDDPSVSSATGPARGRERKREDLASTHDRVLPVPHHPLLGDLLKRVDELARSDHEVRERDAERAR